MNGLKLYDGVPPASTPSTRRLDVVARAVSECTCLARASGPRNASKWLKLDKETTHTMLRGRRARAGSSIGSSSSSTFSNKKGAPNWIAPGADMEDKYAPQEHDICDAVLGEFFADKRVNRRGFRNWDIAGMAKRGL